MLGFPKDDFDGTIDTSRPWSGVEGGDVPMTDFGGRYRRVKLLGQGGMGEVWLAFDIELDDRPVAIKIIRSDMLADQDGLRRFQQEMRLASKMHHPNIMTVLTSGTDHGIPFMVMEYLEGHDLRKAPLGWDAGEIARIGRETCAALAYAHGLGVVHRDITPSNVFLCDTGLVKVTDFGIAKALTGSKITQPGTMIGTFAYMAPEQWLGEPATFGIDIWAVGCVLYELLSGRLPREYPTPVEYVTAAARGERVAPLPNTVDAPPWLRAAVMEMLQSHPRSRPAAADCVRLLSGPETNLSQVLPPPVPAWTRTTPAEQAPTTGIMKHGPDRPDPANQDGGEQNREPAPTEEGLRSATPMPPTPTGPSVTGPPTPPRGRRRLATVATVAVIAAFATYVGLFGIGGHRPTRTGPPETQSQETVTKIPVPPAVLTDPAYAAASVVFSPTGKLLAVGGRGQLFSPEGGSVYLWNLVTRKIIATLTDPNGKGVISVAFGPEGSTLAAGDLNGTTYLWNPATQQVIARLTDPGGQEVDSVAFSRDDATLAAGDSNGNTYIWNLATQQVIARLTDPGGQEVDSVAFSRDDATLAAGDDNGNTYIWNLANQKIVATLHHPQSSVSASIPTVNNSVAFSPNGKTLAAGFYGCTFIWNLATRKVISSLCDPGSYGVISVAFGPGGTTLATADANGVTFLWNLATRTVAARFYIRGTEAADSVAFGPSNDLMTVGQENGTIYMWAIRVSRK
jgi:eukaryotic-like serine/threonine-protein kinase